MSSITARNDLAPQTEELPPGRIASIDVFRGLTMAVMIFVNDLGSVRGLPWWTHHAHAAENRMTYVDMVFPFFLFIIGLSLPLAMDQRLRKQPSYGALIWHIFVRSLSLIALGVILANGPSGDASRMHLNPNGWSLLALAGMVLFLLVLRGSSPRTLRILHVAGLLLAMLMFALFRHRPEDGVGAWFDFSYLEILGLLGCTYFVVSLLFLLTKTWRWAAFGWTALLLLFSIACAAKWCSFQDRLPLYAWPLGDGTMAFVTMAGVATAAIFSRDAKLSSNARLGLAGSFALLMLVAGWFLMPLGISKIRDTPTWGLYSAGAAVLCFAGLYWLCDVRKQVLWAAPVRPAGANTLLTYLLPDIWYFTLGLLGIHLFRRHLNYGAAGVFRSLAFTALMLLISAGLTRKGVRLQL